jgi:Domain of unknown function (DUF4118)
MDRMPQFLTRDRAAFAAGVLAPLAVSLILVPFRNHLSAANSALILVVVVVAVASLGNRVAGALAALSAAVWFDFFLTQPYQRLSITNGDDITAAALLLVVGLAVSQLAAYARRLQVVTITNADHLMQIQQTVQMVQSGSAVNAVVNHVRSQLVSVLGLTGCRFEYGVLTGQHPRLTRDGRVVVGRVRQDTDRQGLPASDVELRVEAGGRYYGRYLLEPAPGNAPSLQARLVAVTLADQVAAAFAATPS